MTTRLCLALWLLAALLSLPCHAQPALAGGPPAVPLPLGGSVTACVATDGTLALHLVSPDTVSAVSISFEGSLPVALADMRRSDLDTLVCRELYPGVDLVARARAGALKYEFRVAPGASWQRIRIRYDGADSVVLLPHGGLSIGASASVLLDRAPLVWQESPSGRRFVDASFKVQGTCVSFDLPQVDPSLPLVIDPDLEWSRALSAEDVWTVSCDSEDNVYVWLRSWSPDVLAPAVTVPFPPTDFLAKFSPSGELLWSKALPFCREWHGYGHCEAEYMYVDDEDNVIMYGAAHALIEPVDRLIGPSSSGDVRDMLIVRIDGSGDVVWQRRLPEMALYSHLGVSAFGNGVLVLAGYLTTALSLDETYPTETDAHVIAIDASGAVRWSATLGGASPDWVKQVCVDRDGNVLAFGATGSQDFDLLDPFDASYGEGGNEYSWSGECFVAKFDHDGRLCWSSFLGGSRDEGLLVNPTSAGYRSNDNFRHGWIPSAVDDDGNFYVSGFTMSQDFPLVNAFDNDFDGTGETFLAKISADGRLVWSTFSDSNPTVFQYSPDPMDYSLQMVPDLFGNLYVFGKTRWPGFPALGGFDTAINADGTFSQDRWDTFVMMLDPAGAIRWSTYLGGDAREDCFRMPSWFGWSVSRRTGWDIALQYPRGGLLVGGRTVSNDFPLRDEFQSVRAGDGFLTAFSPWGTLTWSSYAGFGGVGVLGVKAVAVDSLGACYALCSADGHSLDALTTPPASPCRSLLIKVSSADPDELAMLARRLPKGFVGIPYQTSLAAAGDSPPFTWSLLRGSLPAGLTLDGSTGAISGTPSTEGKRRFTVKLSDSHQPQRALAGDYAIGIVADNAPPSLSALSAPDHVCERLDDSVTVTALADDRGRGDSLITGAEYFIGDPGEPGTGAPMAASDGAFDSSLETLTATVDTSSWRAPGSRDIAVRVQEETGRWSGAARISLDMVDTIAPASVDDLTLEFSYLHDVAASSDWRLEGLADASVQSTTIDLGSARPVVGVSLAPDAVLTYFPRSFSIWGSSDGSDWTRIALQSDWKPVRTSTLWQCEPIEARYVKIEAVPVLSRRAKAYALAVREINVYSTDTANPAVVRWTAAEEDASQDGRAVSDCDLRVGFNWFQPPPFDALEPVATAAPKQPGEIEELQVDLGWHFGTLWGSLRSVDADSNCSGPSNTAMVDVLPYGFQPASPAEAVPVSPLAAMQFSFYRGAGLKNLKIAFSDRADFPNRAVRHDGITSKTVRFPIKADNSWWKATRSQWKALMKLGAVSGKLYWRVEAKTLSNSVVVGPARSVTIPSP